MKTIVKTGTVDIPDGVKVEVSSRSITVTGPRGKVSRSLKHLPIDITFKNETTIKIDRWFTYGKQAACIRTACSHVSNMIIGVTLVRRGCACPFRPSRDGPCLARRHAGEPHRHAALWPAHRIRPVVERQRARCRFPTPLVPPTCARASSTRCASCTLTSPST